MILRYARADGATFDEMRLNFHKGALSSLGDAILIWVNEGDFWMMNPPPVNFDEEAAKKIREDRIIKEADEIRARRAVS